MQLKVNVRFGNEELKWNSEIKAAQQKIKEKRQT